MGAPSAQELMSVVLPKPGGATTSVSGLASPASSFTSGTNLVIDGALTKGVQF